MQQLNSSNNITIADLKINGKYNNAQITQAFKCSSQGGMRKSNKTNTLVLFAIHYKSLYSDYWENGVMKYTGMGSKGDQSDNFMQNKTLKKSNENGVSVHLFESYNDQEYIYEGIVELIEDPYYDVEEDIKGNLRKVVKFPLKRKSDIPIDISKNDIDASNDAKEKKLKKLSLVELKKQAKKSGKKNPKKQTASTNVVERSPAVKAYTKLRANGICDLCNQKAPFEDKENNPYLECHHVFNLADGGPDGIYNTVALCPNCHKKMHVLKRKKDNDKLISKIKAYLEADNDQESLDEFKKIF